MAAVGNLELKTDKDLGKDAEISLLELFPYTERVKEFVLKADVIHDQTILNIIIAKLFNIDTMANTARRKDDKIHLWALMKYGHSSKKLKP